MTRIAKIFALAISVMLLSLQVVFAGSVTVMGHGSNERAALHDAMRQAIEQEIGTYVDSSTYVENYQVINDRIYAQSEGYVSGYEVLNSSYDNGIYTMTIRADVRSELLRTDLMSKLQKKAVIGANMMDPRIGILAMDANGNEYVELENVIISGLQEQGFSRLIDLTQIDASVRQRIARADLSNDVALKNMLSTQFHVDYMVTAKVTQTNQGLSDTKLHIPDENSPIKEIPLEIFFPAVTSLGKSHVDIAARMLNVNTGEIVYAGVASADGRGSNSSAKAMNKAVADIVANLSHAALQKAANPEQHISVIITQNALGTMSQAYQRIANLPGVSQVFTRSTSYGNIEVDVNYYGTAYDLAAEMERDGIAITEMTSEYIKI